LTLPVPFNAENMFAVRAFEAAATRRMSASSVRESRSVCASRFTSGSHAPVTMIRADGAAARSCLTIAAKRDAKAAIARGAALRFSDSGSTSFPQSVSVIGSTRPG
jgi:hypothetical protein